jgi:hypothetical protein
MPASGSGRTLGFRQPSSPRHRHGHQEIRGGCQPHVLAAFQVELARFLAAQAQPQEPVPAQLPIAVVAFES